MLSRNCVVYTFGYTRKIRIWPLNVKHVSLPKLASAYSALNRTLVEVWATCAMTEAYPDTREQSLQSYPRTSPQDWLGGRTHAPNNPSSNGHDVLIHVPTEGAHMNIYRDGYSRLCLFEDSSQIIVTTVLKVETYNGGN